MVTVVLYTAAQAEYAQSMTFDVESAESRLNPRAVTAPAPYPYAGMFITGIQVITDPDNDALAAWLISLPQVSIVPSEAFPPEDEA